MNSSLLKAILAMDSYNRGYDRGIILSDTADSIGLKIGNAIVIRESDISANTAGVNAGFYGIAYQTSDGEKIVAYRGTDTDPELWAAFLSGDLSKFLTPDVLNGYGVAVGSPAGKQAELAFKFYNDVAGVIVDPTTANISLVGHSLGGGLAGLIGAVYNRPALMFDNMAFQLASENTYKLSVPSAAAAAGMTYNPNLKQLVYGTFSPWAVDLTRLQTEYVDGEFLKANRVGQSSSIPQIVYNLGTGVYGFGEDQLGPVDAHSMATLVILKYAQGASTDWNTAAKYFWPVMYNDAFAQSIGTGSIEGGLKDKNDFSGILRQIIAYSAIDEGPTKDSMPFGNTGIKALYDDANDFGKALVLKDANNVFVASSALSIYATLISESFVNYAGQLALSKILDSANPLAKQGIINFSAGSSGNNPHAFANQAFEIDFSHYKWFDSINSFPNMVGKDNLISKILKDMGGGDDTVILSKMTEIWGTDYDIGRVIFTATSVSGYTFATDVYPRESNIFVTADGLNYSNQLIYGTVENDLFYGRGAEGSNTYFWGSKGNDIYYGGLGMDTLSYERISQGIIVDSANSKISYLATGTIKADYFSDKIDQVTGSQLKDYFLVSENGPKFVGGGGRDTYDLSLIMGPVLLNAPGAYFGGTWSSLNNSQINNTFSGMTDFILTPYNDTLNMVVGNSPSSGAYNSIDTGSGVDTVSAAEWGAVVDTTGKFILSLGSVKNAEIFKIDYVSILSLGHKYISSQTQNSSSVLDYSGYHKSLSFFITSGYKDGSVTDGQYTDVIGSESSLGYRKIIGTDFGDVFTIDTAFSNQSIYTKDILSGYGNDLLVVSGGLTNKLNYIYTGGNDRIQGGFLGKIILGPDITFNDLTLSGNAILIANHGSIIFDGQASLSSVMLWSSYYPPSFGYVGTQHTDTITILSPTSAPFHTENGDDVITVNSGGVTVRAGMGNDSIIGSQTLAGSNLSNPNYFYGGVGNDTIIGTNGIDIIRGEGDNDIIWGNAGDDVLYGNQGDDILNGNAGNDSIYGGDGNDIIDGGTGNDTLIGNYGDDIIRGGQGSDIMDGVEGNDTYVFSLGDGNDSVFDGGADYIDVIKFDATVLASTIRFVNAGSGYLNIFYGNSDRIQVSRQFADILPSEGYYNLDGIDKVILANGTEYNLGSTLTDRYVIQ